MTSNKTATFAGKTADEWRAESRNSRMSAYESFERSDTDGFLSQWAADKMASRYEWLAELAENGGMARKAVPVDPVTRAIIPGRWLETRYGTSYRTNDGRWLTESRARDLVRYRAAHARKGFVLAWALVPQILNRKSFLTYDNEDQSNWQVTTEDVAPLP